MVVPGSVSLVLTLLAIPAASRPFDIAADSVARDALKAWQAPGLAMAIVGDDKVIYLKGHGVRARGRPEPVTPDTLFAIGSLTKAFTAASIGQLVDDGKADWDDPVRKHL